jgi:hypothetical protein
MFHDASETSRAHKRLESWGSEQSRTGGLDLVKIFQSLNRGAHHGYAGSLDGLVERSEKLTELLSSKLSKP